MQQLLRDNLLSCAAAFAEERKVALSTLGKMVANDAPFFQRLRDHSKTFTAQKYDDVMLWFSTNWPDGKAWPKGVVRPNAPNTPLSDDTAHHAGASLTGPIPESGESLRAGAGEDRAGVRAGADG